MVWAGGWAEEITRKEKRKTFRESTWSPGNEAQSKQISQQVVCYRDGNEMGELPMEERRDSKHLKLV